MKQTIITVLLVLVAMAGQGQTTKNSCSIPKDSLCQERIVKSDTVNCPLDKQFLLKANVTNKEESKSNLPKIALPKNDIYREKFTNLQLINVVGSHLSRWVWCRPLVDRWNYGTYLINYRIIQKSVTQICIIRKFWLSLHQKTNNRWEYDKESFPDIRL